MKRSASLALAAVPLVLLTNSLSAAVQGSTPDSREPVVPYAAILGDWRGNSLCADLASDPACKDEIVVYLFDSIAAPPRMVNLHAFRVVEGARDSMYVMPFAYRHSTLTWEAEFTTDDFHGRWTLRGRGDNLVGALVELPSQRVVRRVMVKFYAPVKKVQSTVPR